jgi:hypothetical protein
MPLSLINLGECMSKINDHLVLVCGFSSTGKSTSLMNLENPEGVLYLNCEAGKRLPFKSKFVEKTITDPLQIIEAFVWAETKTNIHTIVVDSLTFLLDMYESLYVLPSTNTMKAWGDFAQYFKNLMQQHVASSTKNVLFTAHVLDTYSESDMEIKTFIPVKGSLKNNGIEASFSCVIATKKVKLKELENYTNDLLTITDDDRMLGYKHVFQTKLTKDTVGERIRGPIGLFIQQETYINNDMQLVFNRLHEYYS